MLKIIIDTDIGCDCDDAGALAVAHCLEKNGYCNLISMTHCTSRVDGCCAIDIINRYYGREDIPVGILQTDGFLDNPDKPYYSAYLKEHYPSRFQNKVQCPDAVRVLREALFSVDEFDAVTLVGIGPMVNLYNLLCSGPDDISPLSGIELLKAVQCRLVVMACCFDDTMQSMLEDSAEWNVYQDIVSAQYVYKNWPTEIYTIPFETGVHIMTGGTLALLPENNPIRVSYEQYAQSSVLLRSSWDQCAVGFAIAPDLGLWTLSEKGKITVKDNGQSIFIPDENGKQHIVGVSSVEKAQVFFEELMIRQFGELPLNCNS